ncbi:AAA family ATPase, partial [Erysipelotrichaceae bacterium HCN-30851]
MYLKSLQILNYRKYNNENNLIHFAKNGYVIRNQCGQKSNYPNDISDCKNKEEKITTDEKINVAKNTTLIVGKNNGGKTTIVEALDFMINGTINDFSSKDINYSFLNNIREEYDRGIFYKTPYVCFELIVDISDQNSYINNIASFLTRESMIKGEITIKVKYCLKEEILFLETVKKKIKDGIFNLLELIDLIDNSSFKIMYLNKEDKEVKDFKLKNLFEIVKISANTVNGENSLSKSFNKIISYRAKQQKLQETEQIKGKIKTFNFETDELLKKDYSESVNTVFGTIISNKKMGMNLHSNFSFDSLLSNNIQYVYSENQNEIPENQFGLGYTNLFMIISNLIEYIEKNPVKSFSSKINLIAIEEPETYMHPQMQELFIRNINEAINLLLSQNQKNIIPQMIITTHSTHILNSKIQEAGSFDFINYTHDINNCAYVTTIRDSDISKDIDQDEFIFIKKHMKFQTADMFFADAVIIVEGDAEYKILPYYIQNDAILNKNYVTVLHCGGAHAKVYDSLLKRLKVPVLIVADLDIKRSTKEKEEFVQITDIEDRETTNETLKYYFEMDDINKTNLNGYEKLSNINPFIISENIYITYQSKVNNYYPTSFEEAFILTNFDNGILNKTLKETKRNTYIAIVKNNEYVNNKDNSF